MVGSVSMPTADSLAASPMWVLDLFRTLSGSLNMPTALFIIVVLVIVVFHREMRGPIGRILKVGPGGIEVGPGSQRGAAGEPEAAFEKLRRFYDEAARQNPEVFKGYPFEQYLSFLEAQFLTETKDGRMMITLAGREFLKYLIDTLKPGPFVF